MHGSQTIPLNNLPLQEQSLHTSRRSLHGSGPLNVRSVGSFSGSPPVSPRESDDLKFCKSVGSVRTQLRGKTVGRWLKDMKEKKKEETRAQNAQVHAAVSVAGVAAAVAAIAAATATSSGDNGQSKTSMAVASAAALVAAQCVEVAECMGADREQMASVVSSAVNVRKPGDIMTLTAGAATGIVYDVCRDVPAWPGRGLLEGGEQRRYFGLKTARGVMEFECGNDKDQQIWTEGIRRLLSLAQNQKKR